MKTYTRTHNIELKDARDDIIRHKPVRINLWKCQENIGYLSINWDFTHMNVEMYTVKRPLVELEQMLRDAKAWSMAKQCDSTDRFVNTNGEAYTNEEE